MFTNITEYIDEHGLKHISANWIATEGDFDNPISPSDPEKPLPDQDSHSDSN